MASVPTRLRQHGQFEALLVAGEDGADTRDGGDRAAEEEDVDEKRGWQLDADVVFESLVAYEASVLLVKVENGRVDREGWACLDEGECQRVDVTDQVCDDFAGVFWDGVTGLEDDCPVMKEVLVKGEESQLGLGGVVKNCRFQRLEDV